MSNIEAVNSFKKPNKLLGVRHVQFFLLFVAIVVAYGVRTIMSVGIIAMMDENPPSDDIPTYPDWTQKNTILSAFFWGYVLPQIGAGQLVKRYGPKWILTVAIFINSLFTILIPVMAASFGETGVIICRVIQGLHQGFLFPSTHNILSKWMAAPERSTVGSFVYTGGPLGTFIAMPLTGLIADSSMGWPAAFYLYGGLGIAWCIIFSWIGANAPENHASISDEERQYIEGVAIGEETKKIPTPWKSILTSLPFWAILVSHCGQNWGFWTLLTEIPSYMKHIMKYEIEDNSVLSALPYLVLWLLSFGFSPLADYLIKRKILSITNTRKILNTIGLMIPAAALIWLGFVDSTQRDLGVGLLIVAVGFNSAIYSGFNVNHIDLSPNHAGTLMGITNSTAGIFSILAPLAVQVIDRAEEDPVLWRIVFSIAAGFYVAVDLFYIIFASGEIQPWNEEPNQQEPVL